MVSRICFIVIYTTFSLEICHLPGFCVLFCEKINYTKSKSLEIKKRDFIILIRQLVKSMKMNKKPWKLNKAFRHYKKFIARQPVFKSTRIFIFRDNKPYKYKSLYCKSHKSSTKNLILKKSLYKKHFIKVNNKQLQVSTVPSLQ